ncbi:MAG UNVERIFIED_CONTAM: hypothetical protein LVT10_15955 [Anaerolineae bacterium]|jgi:hypothetical protein
MMVRPIRLCMAVLGLSALFAGISGTFLGHRYKWLNPTEAFRQTVQAAFEATLTAQAPTLYRHRHRSRQRAKGGHALSDVAHP